MLPLPNDFAAQEDLRAKLLFQYGPERAGAILTGQDEKTNADLAAWERIIAHGRTPDPKKLQFEKSVRRIVDSIVRGLRGG